jgi:3-hydroxybutyrate dehydrogenase
MRKALITGGTKGIGQAITSKLKESGFDTITCAREGADIQCDVTDRKQVEQMREQIGHIDILINNVGGVRTAPFLKMEEQDWDWHFQVNVKTILYCAQAFLPSMLERKWGRIINVASTAGKIGGKYISAYVSAKHAVIGLTRALAQELAASRITVNAVCPSFVDTPMLQAQATGIAERTGKTTDEILERFRNMNPQKRFVTPEEVASTVLFLIENEGVNGQALSICGGETAS